MARTKVATPITKWGNSVGIRISREVLKKAEMKEGDRVEIDVEAPGVLRLRSYQPPLTLEALVSRITPENRHSETLWGAKRGKEVW